jgi:putative ABC transport system permease protein
VSLLVHRTDEPTVVRSSPAPAPPRVSGWMVRWRLALRMARRDARRAKGRTALVVLMVGLPVMAIVAGDTLYRTNDVTAVESLLGRLGSADALIQGFAREPIHADPLWGSAYDGPADPGEPWTAHEVTALLPAGSRIVERQIGPMAYRTGIGYATVDAYADDLADPLRAGAFDVLDGRAPARAGEVAVSRAVADRGIEVGDRLEVTLDDVPLTVVGVLSIDAQGQSPFLVLSPASSELIEHSTDEFFADVPGGLDWPAVQDLNAQGLVVVSRNVVENPPPESEYLPPEWGSSGSGLSPAQFAVVALIVVALVLEVVLLAGPAFAVGLRRQRRDLALLAANGATAADLRRSVLASGLFLGAGAAVAGALLGIGLVRVAVPVLEDRTTAAFGPFEVAPLDVLIIVAVGTLAGLIAAWVPARQAARTDVVTTLSGRRGQVRSSWHWPVVGLLVTLVGLGLTVLGAQGTEIGVAAGAVLVVVGVVLATPWLVGLLVPLARRLPVAGRLAVRDATRNRTRTAPAVAAVMATVAGVTTLAIGSTSDSAESQRNYVPQAPMGAALVQVFDGEAPVDWAAVEGIVQEWVPGASIGQVQTAMWTEEEPLSLWVMRADCAAPTLDCSLGFGPTEDVVMSTFGPDVVSLDEDVLAATTAPAVRDAALAAFRSGRAVVFGRGIVTDSGVVDLQSTEWTGSEDEPRERVSLPATEVSLPAGVTSAPARVVVPPSLVDRLPVPFETSQLVVGGPEHPVTAEQERDLREALTAVSPNSNVYVERGWIDDQWLARLLLILVGGALVLVSTLTATGLALADARPDLSTLAAIGAAPRTRRLMAMGSAAVIGVFGALLGVLAGLAPGIAVAYPLTSNDYGSGASSLVVIPWDLLAAVAVGVPLLAVVVTGLAVRSRLPMQRRVTG